jgi:PAS domain S-box-containing protein
VRFESEGRSLVYAAHIDVTERVLAERALRTSEGRYRRLVETSHEGICTVDATGCITYANGRLAEMLGYSVVDLAGWPIFTFMAPDVAFNARTRFARRSRGISEVDEIPFLRRDGSTMWAWKSASTMFDDGGAFVGAVYVLSDITEHRSAQRRLAASERHFRALTEQSTELVTVLDPQGVIRYANPAWERLLGRPNDEAVGRSVFEFLHPDDRAAVFAQFETLVREPGALVSVEYRAAHADGTWRVLQTVAHNLVGDPAVEGIVVNARDVTERRRAEDALRENEQRYRLLFERNPLPMYVADAETRRFLAVNDAAVAHYGYSREEFLSMLLDEIRPEEDRASFRSTFDTMLDGVASGTLRHRRRDGSLIDVMVTVDTVTFGDRPARLVASNDVTEPLRVEAQLRVARKQTELLLASAGEGIYALDAEGRTTFVNPAAARLLGGRQDDLLGADLHALLHHTHADGSAYEEGDCPIRRSLIDGTVHRVDTDVFWRLDGSSFPVEYVSTPLREGGRIVGVVVAFQDITQRRHLEMQLSQAQKMEAVGRLAGGVAHDFNNLLTVITSYTLMLLTELPAEDPVRPDLREIQAASERAAGLTRQLLAFSRQQVLSPRVIDLRQVVADTANMLRRLVGEDIELTIGGADGPTSVHADQGQIEQVVMNLAVNARDAMLSGGRLTIDVGAVTLSEASAERRVYVEPGEYVRVTVQDTGCGMDAATLEKIFDPFFTTKDAGKGTGLGLATVYGIVKQSGGYILVDSTPGEGTAFRIYLPRVAEMPEVREASAAEAPALARMSATLLLAEDEDALRNITERLLRKRGYTVLCARDGEHALEVAAQHDGPIDLLVTDVVMPRMSGQELAERLTQRHGDIPVLFMTGYSMEAVANHGMLRPGARLLHKPFTPHDLALAASELLNATSNALRVSGEHRVSPTGEVL